MSTIKSPFPSSVPLLYAASPLPQALHFPAHRLTLLLRFSEQADRDAVRKFAKEGRTDVNIVTAYWGDVQPWERLEWVREEPAIAWLNSVSVPSCFPPLDPTSHLSLSLFLGPTLLLQSSQLPRCLSLPSLTHVSSLQALADLITQGKTADLIWAYSQVKERCGDMDQKGLEELLTLLSHIYELDLRTALDSFLLSKWGADSDDIVSLEDVTFKQFARRLKNYCGEKAGKGREIDWKREAETLRSRLETAEVRTASLRKELEEKDSVIMDLRRRLEDREGQTSITLSRLRKSPSGKSQTSTFALRLEENSPGPELPEDNGNELDPLPQSPSFKKKLGKRKVMAVRTVLAGEVGNPGIWHKAESESPVLKPQQVSVEMFAISPLINPRPMAAHARRKSPPKVGKTPRSQQRKPEAELQPIKQPNRLVFSSNRRTM